MAIGNGSGRLHGPRWPGESLFWYLRGEPEKEVPLALGWLGREGVSLQLLGPSCGEGLSANEANTEDSGGEG